MQAFDVAQGRITYRFGRPRVNKSYRLGQGQPAQLQVTVIDQLCEFGVNIAINEQNVGLTAGVVQVTDDFGQRLNFAVGRAREFVQNEKAATAVKLFEDADTPAVLAHPRQGRAEHRIQRAHDVVHAKAIPAGGPDPDDAVGEVMDRIPGSSGSKGTLAVALAPADCQRRLLVRFKQPLAQSLQFHIASAEAAQPVDTQIVPDSREIVSHQSMLA